MKIKVYSTSDDNSISIVNERKFSYDNYGIKSYESIQLTKDDIKDLIKQLEEIIK